MVNITQATLTAGVGTGGTGTISTLDNLPNIQQISQIGTVAGSIAAVKAASTAPVASDPALVVAISPNGVNANGSATSANSAPVVPASDWIGRVNMQQTYNTVAASQTAQALTGGSGGATGDYLEGLLIVPAAAAAGAVSIKDGAGSAISIFAGGGTTALPTLAPFFVPIDAVSTAGAWSVTTGVSVSCIATGKFH